MEQATNVYTQFWSIWVINNGHFQRGFDSFGQRHEVRAWLPRQNREEACVVLSEVKLRSCVRRLGELELCALRDAPNDETVFSMAALLECTRPFELTGPHNTWSRSQTPTSSPKLIASG
ncbi:hypothetical protein ERJ75_001576800 [Trypanosoma vivax]|nr:hypothetical protein TRVL_07897 [Trypanosoma vivax]KAH8605680.1 hypothetical protein ERJ75_001576800 [Trypanosoma vivax]